MTVKRKNLLARIGLFFGIFLPMNGIPDLFERALDFCKGKEPDEEIQFWTEWLARGRALHAQAARTDGQAVNFATTAPEAHQ